MKPLIILICTLMLGCSSVGAQVDEEKYKEQVKKCEQNNGVQSIRYFASDAYPYWKIETNCNNGAFFREFYKEAK